MKLPKLLDDFISLFFPNNCPGCRNKLYENEGIICTKCLVDLPRVNFYNDEENQVAKLFWGRVYIEHATTFVYFSKGGIVQSLLHQFKYNGRKEIGFELGKLFGLELNKFEKYKNFDMVIPVPLHQKKLKQRGFNQSEIIADGIASVLNLPVKKNIISRIRETETQTKKTRIQRWENVTGIFAVNHPEVLINKHVLLVDDVVTTGATLEACAQEILKTKNTKVSIVTLAVA